MNAFTTTVFTSTTAVLLLLFAKTTCSCGGYQLEVDYIRNCGDSHNVIELSDNFTVFLKGNCELYFRGCITAHDNITSVEIDYNVQKDLIKRSGKKDGCSNLENKSEDVEMGLQILGLPKSCPIYKSTACLGNKPINLSKYKLRMNILAGRLTGKVHLTTNAGKSCMEFSAKLINGLVKVLPTIRNIMIG